MEIKEVEKAEIPKPLIWKGVFILAVFLLIVFGIWHFSSGIREDLLNKNATTTALKLSSKKKAEIPEAPEPSYYNTWIKFMPSASVKETYPEKEYVELVVVQPNLSGADATGWMLKNSQGVEAPLGQVSALPLSGKVNATEALKIRAGDHLFISTGRSPIGVSFRANVCSSYMEQFQDFIPPLSGECPYISSEKNFYLLDGKCQTFIQNTRRCETATQALPPDITASCKAFLDSTASYNNCVAIHKNDPNFYLKELRIYLGKDKELWAAPKDTVTLLDEKGKLIDIFKY
jgi:hypothetical protein